MVPTEHVCLEVSDTNFDTNESHKTWATVYFKNTEAPTFVYKYGPSKIAEALQQAIRFVGGPKLVMIFLAHTTAALTREPQDTVTDHKASWAGF